MEIAALDPHDGAALGEWFDLHVAVRRADLPDYPELSRRDTEGSVTSPWPGYRLEHWVVRDDTGRIVGAAELMLPVLDNTTIAYLDLAVHPERRRQGIGRALLTHAAARARQAGRRRLIWGSCEALPGGPQRSPAPTAFAVSVGAHRATEDTHSRLTLSTVDEKALADRLAAAWQLATGYSVVQWRDVAPDEIVGDLAVLEARMSTDAPMGDLDVTAEKVDAERIRADERARLDRGRRSYHTAARHDATGAIVAITRMSLHDGVPHWASQTITIVLPEHRGHRLGTNVKLENLAQVRAAEPQLCHIDTRNASTNRFMIAINEAMGFRPVDRWPGWQLTI